MYIDDEREKVGNIKTRGVVLLGLMIMVSAPIYAASLLMNFEQGNLSSSTGGYFIGYENDRTHGPDLQTVVPDTTFGAEGSKGCMKDTVSQGGIYMTYISNPNQKALIPQASGANRLSFFIKIPNGYPMKPDCNLNVGTYSRDPVNGDPYGLGTHFYHYMNIPGTAYWTKVVLNQHPQHQTGVTVAPENNPVAWGYYNGFTRFYIDMQQDSPSYPSIVYIDHVNFYNVSEPENDDTINSITCSYYGNGHFLIGWHGNSQYTFNGHRYEVRYSTSPITNTNYASARIVSGGPFTRKAQTGTYNFIMADFTIAAQDNIRYYFAIKDIDSSSTYVSKIDYLISSQAVDNTPPATPAGVKVQVIN